MQPAKRSEYPYVNWLWQLYDGVLNRGEQDAFLIATRQCSYALFNGTTFRSGREVVDSYLALTGMIGKRPVKLDRAMIERDVVIGPETFANCANLWWTVDWTHGAQHPGDAVFGATQVLFRDDHEIVQIRDLWAPLPGR